MSSLSFSSFVILISSHPSPFSFGDHSGHTARFQYSAHQELKVELQQVSWLPSSCFFVLFLVSLYLLLPRLLSDTLILTLTFSISLYLFLSFFLSLPCIVACCCHLWRTLACAPRTSLQHGVPHHFGNPRERLLSSRPRCIFFLMF